MRLESPYPLFDGLNLTWEMLEGLAKHNGPVAHPGWALTEGDAAFPLDLGRRSSLEAQVAAIADDIAYDKHDIDDGLRAGLLSFDQILDVPLIARGWEQALERFAGTDPTRLVGELIRSEIGAMVNDVIAETQKRIAASGIETAADVRAADHQLVGFSDAMRDDERTLKRFMYANLYHHQRQLDAAEAARRVVDGLFAAYRADPALMSPEWHTRLPGEEPWRARHIADFIAGMTDRYAIARYREVVGEIDLPEGF
jgi:dGTPase